MDQDKNKDDKVYLQLMLDAFSKIKNFTDSISYESFSADNKTQSAVIMQLQVVSELAKKVPERMKAGIDVPWKNMAGFRDMISHDYFGLDLMTVWHTVVESVPEAEAEIRKYLETCK